MFINEYGCQCSGIPVRTITEKIVAEVLQDVADAQAINARRTYRNWVSVEVSAADETNPAWEDFQSETRYR